MNRIPAHIAFIMDGNGRWAKKRKMPRTYGHHEGTKTIRNLALEANNLGVKAMTVYAFSTENFKREQSEVEYIFKLPKEFFSLYFQELMDNNVRIMTTIVGKGAHRLKISAGNHFFEFEVLALSHSVHFPSCVLLPFIIEQN